MKEKFKAHFKLPINGFLEPMDLKDTRIGFSVYKTGFADGFKSLFRVYIQDDELDKVRSRKSIIVTASYGKESDNGIILSSNTFKRKLNWPVDFISEGEFFYDIDGDRLYYRNKEITGLDMLNQANNWHTKTTKPFEGAWIRFKLFWFHFILASFWKLLFKILAIFQYFVSGEKIKIFHDLTKPQSYQYQTLNVKKSELIDLWGYQVKPWIAGIYGFLHLTIYLIFYNYDYRPLWLVVLFKNNFLTFIYGVVSLGLTNTLLPVIFQPINFKGLLKLIQTTHWNFAIKKVKI